MLFNLLGMVCNIFARQVIIKKVLVLLESTCENRSACGWRHTSREVNIVSWIRLNWVVDGGK